MVLAPAFPGKMELHTELVSGLREVCFNSRATCLRNDSSLRKTPSKVEGFPGNNT